VSQSVIDSPVSDPARCIRSLSWRSPEGLKQRCTWGRRILEGDTSADVAVRPRNADVTHSVYGVVFPARGFPASAVASGRITVAGPRSLTSINAGPTHLVPQRLRINPNRRATQATAPLDLPLSPWSVPGHLRAALHQLQRVLTRRRHALILSKVRVSIRPLSGHHGLRWPAPRSIGRQKAYAAGQPARRVCRCGTSQLRVMGALVAVLVVFAHDRLQSLQIIRWLTC
jgi:hypothetical protein